MHTHTHTHPISQQVDQLVISKLVESISMATTSLISLVQLLDKVKNMVISDHIQQEVRNTNSSVCTHKPHPPGYTHQATPTSVAREQTYILL